MLAFASDFDETLYFHRQDPHLHQEDLDAISRFQEEGNLFGTCSGRSYQGILQSLEGKIRFDFYVMVSGALLLDRDGAVLEKRCMDRDVCFSIYHRYQEIGPMVFQAGNTVYSLGESYYPMQTRISSLEEIPEDLYGLSLAAGNPERAQRIADEINATYPCVSAFRNVFYVDIIPAGCSKGLGLARIKAHFPISRLGGMGDSYNDIPLLSACDQAYTFPHVPEQVKEASQVITDSVAQALAHFQSLGS